MKKGVFTNVVYVLLLVILAVAAIAAIPRMGSSLDNKLSQNTAKMIEKVGADYVPIVQKTPDRYKLLVDQAEKGFDLEQEYVFPSFMAQDYFKGYDDMNSIKELQFPRDHKAQTDYQFGWYFWSGNFFDENGNEVDLVIVFFRRSLYPPAIAHEMGLTDLENQVVQTVVAVNYGDENLHVTGSNPFTSGTSGELEYNNDPFLASVGKSTASSHQEGELFPMKITVDDPEADLHIDLDLNESKPMLLQGDKGRDPSIYGIGSWYYSYPNIKTTGIVTHAGETRNIGGKMWMDHQWMAGISPIGYPRNLFIQALANITNGFKQKNPAGLGWDWSDIQFDDDTEITFASAHSTATADLKNKGENPPDNETRDLSGKYIDEQGNASDITGTVTINKWMKSEKSGAWFPNGWDIKIPDQKIEVTMTPTVDNQFIYSAGSEIREGGTFVQGSKNGKDISGYGFGEGVNYSGQDYIQAESMKILGIKNTPENKDLLTAHPPGAWLVIQSICVLISPVVLLILIIMLVVRYVRKKHRS